MVQTLSMGAVSLLLAAAAAVEDSPKPFPSINMDTGDCQNPVPPSIELARGFAAWNSAWQRFSGVIPIGNTNGGNFPTAARPPAVDFDQNQVLTVFGTGPIAGYQLVDSFIQKRKIHVRLEAVPLSTRANLSGVNANPYAFIIFPKSKYPMEVEFPSTDQNGNQAWRSVAKFEGIKQQSDQGSGN